MFPRSESTPPEYSRGHVTQLCRGLGFVLILALGWTTRDYEGFVTGFVTVGISAGVDPFG